MLNCKSFWKVFSVLQRWSWHEGGTCFDAGIVWSTTRELLELFASPPSTKGPTTAQCAFCRLSTRLPLYPKMPCVVYRGIEAFEFYALPPSASTKGPTTARGAALFTVPLVIPSPHTLLFYYATAGLTSPHWAPYIFSQIRSPTHRSLTNSWTKLFEQWWRGRPVFSIVVLLLLSIVVVVIVLLIVIVIVSTGDHLFEIGLEPDKISRCKKRK